MPNYLVGLDIGSANVKAAVGELKRDGKLSLIEMIKMSSAGVRKGAIDDLAEATRTINQVLGEIKKISKAAVKNIFLNINSGDIKVHSSRGNVAVSRADYEINKEDIERAVQASQAIALPANRMVLHAITKEFVVDGMGDIRDPQGMIGKKLEVNSLIVDAFAPVVKNLMKCVEIAGGSISGIILGPLANARSVLSKNQKDLGVALVDIGFGKTSMAVYEENKLVHAAVFPMGSGNITNDLAIGLKTSVVAAEMIKFSFGSALAKLVPSREQINLTKIDPTTRGSVSRRQISEIIEVRLVEVLEFVNNELKRVGKAGQLPAGAIIVGGGAKMPGVVDLAKQELRLAAQIGVPDTSSMVIDNPELSAKIEDPEYACALGLLLSGADRFQDEGMVSLNISAKDWLKKIIDLFKP